MKIQVLGTGCASCKKIYELTQKAAEELQLSEKVEYVTDIEKIIAMGIMQTPSIAIDGKPVMSGSVPSMEKIKDILSLSCCDNECCGMDKNGCCKENTQSKK